MNTAPPPPKIEQLRLELIELLHNFEARLAQDELRAQVLELVSATRLLREMGVSLLQGDDANSGRDRILKYLRKYEGYVISGDELAVVSGISQYARRIRELRRDFGWPIYSGRVVAEILAEASSEEAQAFTADIPDDAVWEMKPDEYILVGEQDRDAAHRWHIANEIRSGSGSIRDRLLAYFRQNVGKPITAEELNYVTKNARSWPRRTRELRTEYGWPIATAMSGRPDLPVGTYVLEADRQAEVHDRNIPDAVRYKVLERDNHRCRCCGWRPTERISGDSDPRTLLELHHIHHHAAGGENTAENLITLCNVDHDALHRAQINGREAFDRWMKKDCNR